MKDFILGILAFILILALLCGAFLLTVFISSKINGVSFYEQLKIWFGYGSWFAEIFKGW